MLDPASDKNVIIPSLSVTISFLWGLRPSTATCRRRPFVVSIFSWTDDIRHDRD